MYLYVHVWHGVCCYGDRGTERMIVVFKSYFSVEGFFCSLVAGLPGACSIAMQT